VAGQEAGPTQGREQLLEELLGNVAALGQLLDRNRAIAGAGELGEGDDGVAGLGGDRDQKPFLPHPSGLG
jgi:hypothetical protein